MLALMTWPQWLLAVTLIGVCLLLMLVILLQRGRGGGVAGAFGGGGGSGAFGAKTGDVFTWITVVVATVFVGLAVVANFAFDESNLPKTEKATVETPTSQEPGEEKDALPLKTFPVKIGDDGKAVPIDIDSTQIVPPTKAGADEKEPENASPSEAAPDSKPSENPAPTTSDDAPDKTGEGTATP